MSKQEKSYLDDYNTPEEKTEALVNNLCYLIKMKGLDPKEIDKKLFNRNYLQPMKHFKKIEFGRLLMYCDFLGVSLQKITTFSYKNVAKKIEIDAAIERKKELESELAKLNMQIKLKQKALNDSYREANIKESRDK